MHTALLQIRTQMEHDIQQIYDDINVGLNKVNNNDIASTLIRLETEKVNIYISDMIIEVRGAAIEELKEREYPEYLTAGAWTKILKDVGMPKIKLCSIQQINFDGNPKTQSPNTTNKDFKKHEQIKRLENRKYASIGTAGIGGVGMVAAVVIPGWEALPITLLCTGSVIMICGSVSAITTQREIETLKRKMEKEQAKPSGNSHAVPDFTKKLTDLQAKNNSKVINDWLDKIEEAIDNLCAANNF